MSEKIEILNNYNFILFTFSSAMERSEDQNLALVREVLIADHIVLKQDLEQQKAKKSGNK